MNNYIFNAAFEIYLVAGAVYILLSSKSSLLSKLKSARPNWSEDFCRQFLVVSKVAIIAGVLVNGYFLAQMIHGEVR
jgi:hypothetical protein